MLSSKSTIFILFFCLKLPSLLVGVFLLKKILKQISFILIFFYTFAKQKIKQNEIASIKKRMDII